jgi:hypothetical protein
MTVTLPQPAVTATDTTTDYTTALSQIRSRIGDVGGLDGTARVYLTDERITAIYTLHPSVLRASVEAVRAILADIARDTDFTAGSISTSRTQVFQQFKDLLGQLEREMQTADTGAYVGGLSAAEARATAARTDITPRAFSVGMDKLW